MKKVAFFAGAAMLMATSCNPWQAEIDQAKHERDSVIEIMKKDSVMLDQYFDIITEVQSNFKQIKDVELGMIDETKGQEGVDSNTRAKLQEDFKLITNNIQQNKEKIAKLEEDLNKSNSQLSGLRGTISKLKKQLAESQQELADLKTQLEAKDVKIAELESSVSFASAQLDSVNQVSTQQAAAIAAQDAALNEVCYIVATKEVLKQKGILEKQLKKGGDLSTSGFTTVDQRDFTELEIESKKLPVLTTRHPLGSFSLLPKNGEKGKYELKIKNYNKFWSQSKHMIVLVK
ncbi:MAG: hypothetical protein MJZ19_02950 [Paludibacteraceae bacterium]|nr:hypothetical protein [Paludibacteraceae bacterium]